jgi:hypothetical protein
MERNSRIVFLRKHVLGTKEITLEDEILLTHHPDHGGSTHY